MAKVMRKIISINLMLLAFASSAQAVDNYDPKTKVLTIPSVMVGNLTYSNVSVKISLNCAEFSAEAYHRH